MPRVSVGPWPRYPISPRTGMMNSIRARPSASVAICSRRPRRPARARDRGDGLARPRDGRNPPLASQLPVGRTGDGHLAAAGPRTVPEALLRSAYRGTVDWPALIPLDRLELLRSLGADRTPEEIVGALIATAIPYRTRTGAIPARRSTARPRAPTATEASQPPRACLA